MNEPNLIKKTYKDFLKQKNVLVILSIFFLIILIGPSYALLSNFKKLDNAVNIKAANMNMSITQSSSIQLEGKLPESDASGLQNADPVTITLKNANTGPFTDTETTKFQNESASTIKIEKFELKLLPDTTKTTTLDNQYIKYAVSTDNGTTYSDPTKLSDSNTIVFTGYNLDLGQTKTILLKMWIDEDSGSNGTNKNYYGSATVEMYQKVNEIFIKFAELASSTNYVKSYDDIITQNPTFNTQDTYTTNPNKRPVYYFTSDDENNYAAQYGNVLFGGFCWQIIRTTDTGGLKLLYNGIAEDNQCLNTRETTTGVIGVNGAYEYMSSYGTDNIYGTGYDYTGNTFTLTGQFSGKTFGIDYDDIIGNYTCLNTTGTCTTLYYIGGRAYGTTPTAYVAKYTIGTTSHYSELGKSPYNAYYFSLSDVGYMYNKHYTYRSGLLSGSQTYAGSVNWNGSKYNLLETSSLSAPDATHHYVCETTDCFQVRYYYYVANSTYYYYVLLEKGDENPITTLLNGDNVNQKDSAIKGYIDTWYRKNIANQGTHITNKIDTSTVYCNDRRTTDITGWDPTKALATTTSTINFYQSTVNKDLSCGQETDRFTAENSNIKAKLTYPVGLLTEPERGLMNSYYAKSYGGTAQNYWGNSPCNFYDREARVRFVYISGVAGNTGTYNANGVRPVITLKPDVSLTGIGTVTDPYKVS